MKTLLSTFVLLATQSLSVYSLAQPQQGSATFAAPEETAPWSVRLSVESTEAFPRIIVRQDASDQTRGSRAGLTSDTTRSERLAIRSGFLKSTKFAVGSEQPQKVYNMWGGYTNEFQDLLGRRPEALAEAKKASVWNAVGLASQAVFFLLQTDYLLTSSSADLDVNRSKNDVSYPVIPVVGTVAVALFSSLKKSSHLKKSVRIYNQLESEADPVEVKGDSVSESMGTHTGYESISSSPKTRRPSESNKLESWYTNWGLGYAGIGYPAQIETFLQALADVDGVSHAAVSLDFLSLYLPRGEHALIGAGINAFGDTYSLDGESFSFAGATIALSAMYFLTSRIGKGFFLRADAGPARIRFESDPSLGSFDESSSGFGYLVGGGYGFPVSSGTRLLLNANYANRSADGDTYGTFNLSVSGLF